MTEIIFFAVGLVCLIASLLMLSRFIAVWWAIVLLLTTPVWFYLALTLGSEMDARKSTQKADALERKLEQIAEEHKAFREQTEKDEKEFEEKQRASAEAWKKDLDSPGTKLD